MEINQCPVFLGRIEVIDGYFCGDMVRMRVNEVATKGHVNGSLSTVEMSEQESLTGHSAFLYEPRRNILCLERNQNGVGSGTLCTYVSEKGELDGYLGLQLIISPEALRRVDEMFQYRSLEVTIANFDHAGALAKNVPSVRGGIHMAQELDAPSLHFKVSMGRRSGGLSGRVRETVRAMLGHGVGSDVTVMKVSGREAGADETTMIDLIKHRVVYEEAVHLSRDHEEWYVSRRDFLRRAWSERRSEIIEICQEEEE